MEKTTLSTKGQIILPKAIRDAHSWRAGTQFTVEDTPSGVLIRPARPFPETTLDQVVGCLKWKGKPKTLAEMEKAIAIGVKRRHALGRY